MDEVDLAQAFPEAYAHFTVHVINPIGNQADTAVHLFSKVQDDKRTKPVHFQIMIPLANVIVDCRIQAFRLKQRFFVFKLCAVNDLYRQ